MAGYQCGKIVVQREVTLDFGIPEISGSSPSSGGGHSAGCMTLIVVFLIIAALMTVFIVGIGWALKSAGA